MSALPIPSPEPKQTRIARRDPSPDYLPARMVNEFVYCPRLFFYEWVEAVFPGERRHIGRLGSTQAGG